MNRFLIEVCVDRVTQAVAAEGAGADRIELNARLDLNGLSPALPDVAEALEILTVPLVVMVRPHDRGFVYTDTEFSGMLEEVAALSHIGAKALAIGALTPEGAIDHERMARAVDAASNCDVVFHRAFDVVPDPERALETLVDLGVTRVLTSGQRPTAEEGIPVLRRLVERANERIEVLPGGDVGPSNAARLVHETGCTQLHGSFRDASGVFDPERLRRTRAQLEKSDQLNRE